MTRGKYQVYYGKIRDSLEEIKNSQGYSNHSKAFAHWFLSNTYGYDEQDIGECIIDGNGDNGIDAIVYDNEHITLFQFKFPDKEKNIDKRINEDTVLKLFNGYEKLLSTRKPRVANENFLKYREIIKSNDIFKYDVVFVVFHDSFSEQAKDAVESKIASIYSETGNTIQYSINDKKSICDLFDRIQKKNRTSISLSYLRYDPSFNLENDIEKEIRSSVGFLSAKKLVEACADKMNIIFDENIRLYEGDNSVNKGIYETASGEESNKFIFYHNGVVFICDECKCSSGTQILTLEGASVVNGCQTINSLKRAYDEGKLKDDVFLQFRVIETTDFDLRAKITEYLNTQTEIKDSYFLANNTFVRELQARLLEKGYFLERLANEYEYKRHLNTIGEYDKNHVLTLEKTIQLCAAFYYNSYAARAKRGKGELFDKTILEDIVTSLNAEKVIHAYECYHNMYSAITLYRKCRRSASNKDFLNYIGEDVTDEHFNNVMDKYIFMNTADLLLLNTIANLETKVNTEDDNVIRGIKILKKAFDKHEGSMLGYQFTKSNLIFSEIQDYISKMHVCE